MSVDLSIVLSGEFREWLLRGFLLSIELTLVTLVLAFPLATFVALLRLSPWKPLRGPRGSPTSKASATCRCWRI